MLRKTDCPRRQAVVVGCAGEIICLPEVGQTLGIQPDKGRFYDGAGADRLGFNNPEVIDWPSCRPDEEQYFPIFFKTEFLDRSQHVEHVLGARIRFALGQG